MADIVPFGKYKGQPIEQLQADPQYSEWLMEQQWFRERFRQPYTALAANREPAETPEHNAMQAKFLNKDLCFHLLEFVGGKPIPTNLDEVKSAADDWISKCRAPEIVDPPVFAEATTSVIFESQGADIEVRFTSAGISKLGMGENRLSAEHRNQFAKWKTTKNYSYYNCHPSCWLYEESKPPLCFDQSYFDWTIPVKVSGYWEARTCGLRVELKPVMSDDYPAVLRQASASHCHSVVIGHYSGAAVSLADVQEIFKSRGIKLLRLSDLS